MKTTPRNSPCPCGSGKKYKACCAVKRTRSQWTMAVSLALFGLAAVWVVAGVVRKATDGSAAAPSGKVWSEEHNHWHDALSAERPPGPAPEGHVWSDEHGHWHDTAGEEVQPPGIAPAGKVWSDEHDHWHDAGAASQVSEPGYSEVDDPQSLIESRND